MRVLPTVMPRLIAGYHEIEGAEPFRIYSDATDEGSLASIFFFPQDYSALPVLLKGSSSDELNALAASTNAIYIFELFATAASVLQLREQLTGERAILFVDNEAACAALTTGTSRVPGALLLVYAPWAITAEQDIRVLDGKGSDWSTSSGPPFPGRRAILLNRTSCGSGFLEGPLIS